MAGTAGANGRPPAANGVFFKPGDPATIYVATTFGLLASPDGCQFRWICEDAQGYGGTFDPAYGVTPTGAILVTTFQGLRASRDGGCSFQPVASELSTIYLVSLDVGATGEVCVGAADPTMPNGIFCSSDDATTFTASSGLSPTAWYQSVKFAPSDPTRVYAVAYQISEQTDAGTRASTVALLRSDDSGESWTTEPVSTAVFGEYQNLSIAAVDPADADVVFVISSLANPPAGGILYRSADGGMTFVDVLETTHPITGVVARDAQHYVVATDFDGLSESTDGGQTFSPLADTQPFECLGERSDGVLFGCGESNVALASSSDAVSWKPVLELDHISGPLTCPFGTIQHDECAVQEYPGLATQLGITPAACGASDGATDGPPIVSTSSPRQGCCDSGGDGTPVVGLFVVVLSLCRRATTTVLRKARSPRWGSRFDHL